MRVTTPLLPTGPRSVNERPAAPRSPGHACSLPVNGMCSLVQGMCKKGLERSGATP